MGKVVTSAGLNEFVSTGKPTEEIKPEPKQKAAAKAEPLEVVKDKPIADVGGEPKKEPPAATEPPVDDATDDDETQKRMAADEALRLIIDKKNVTIGRKHKEMREAREAAEEAERFAENQFNERRLIEERAAKLEAELNELKARTAPPKAEELVKPDPAKFTDEKGQFKAFEYAEALAAYAAKTAVAEDRKAQAEAQRAQELAQAEAVARQRVAATIAKHPDFEAVMAATDLKTHTAVLQYLSASEQIGEVSYYLAKHPEYVERINKLNPLKAIAEIGKLEATLEKPPAAATTTEAPPAVAKISGAPAPIKPLSSATTVDTNTDPAKMNFKQLRAYERSRMRR